MTITHDHDTPAGPGWTIPPGVDPLDDLTAGELGTIGRALKCDPYLAANDGDPETGRGAGLRWVALAHLAWLWHKRTDPAAKLSAWLDVKPMTLLDVLDLAGDDDPPAGDDGDGEADENPTDSPAGSPSPAPGESTPTS